MKETHVTVRVPLEDSRDLLESSRRACLSFVVDGGPWIEPVVFRHADGRYAVGLGEGGRQPQNGSEVVLLIDDGILFFELRAVYVRGRVKPLSVEHREGMLWLEVEPGKVTSWNYGRMRVEDGSRRH